MRDRDPNRWCLPLVAAIVVAAGVAVAGPVEQVGSTLGAADTIAYSTGTAKAWRTLSAQLDTSIGSGQGNLATRGISGWGALIPGSGGLPLVSVGPAAVPGYSVLTYSGGGTGLSAAPSNGQLAIGNGAGYTLATLTQGAGVTVTSAAGSITVAATAAVDPATNGFRLTLTSGTPVTTADVTAAGTIYLTPYASSSIATYNGTAWAVVTSNEISQVVSNLINGKNYDVFAYNNAGTLKIQDLVVWTDDTTRATALARKDGVWVKTGVPTDRYVGTIRTTAITTTEDSAAKRFVWNADNRAPRPLRVIEGTASWSYTTATWRQANGAAANQIAFVRGLNETPVRCNVVGFGANDGAQCFVPVGIGLDSTTVNSATLMGGGRAQTAQYEVSTAEYVAFPALGYHYLAWLEYSQLATGITTWWGDGDNVPVLFQAGIAGEIDG